MDISNRVAIVTGSARGIGQAIALKLAEVGATVVGNDIGEASFVGTEHCSVQIRGFIFLIVPSSQRQ